MKKKLSVFFAAEVVVCAAYVLLGTALPNLFGEIVSFPFRQIGLGLRALSLCGGVGNVIAIILYVAFCLIPAVADQIIARKKKNHGEDFLLILLSVVLFFVMYLMVNPHLQAEYLGQMQSLMGTEMLGALAYSILAGWAALKVLRKCFGAEQGRLMDYLNILLIAVAAFLTLTAFGTGLDGLLDSFTNLRSDNRGTEDTLGLTYVFLTLQYAVSILPNLLSCGVILNAVEMLTEMKRETYSDAVIACAEKLSASCGRMMKIVVTTNIFFNLLQTVFMKNLRVVNTVIQLPLTTLVLAIALLLMAQFIRSHKELKEENESFI